MSRFEYKVVTAPRKPGKARRIKGFDDKYAHTLSTLMNELAADGWQYARAESLPVDEKSGLMGKYSEKYLSLLVFQRPVTAATSQSADGDPVIGAPLATENTDDGRVEPKLNVSTAEEKTELSDDEFVENMRNLLENENSKD